MGGMETIQGRMDASGKTIGVVVSRWNELITKELLAGALDTLESHGNPSVVVVHVPGTWEIPVAALRLLDDRKVDGVVALGCVLQGATPHAQLLASDVGSALMSLQTRFGKPISWGILTPDTQDQALERVGLKMGHKGREAALAVIEMIGVLGQIARP